MQCQRRKTRCLPGSGESCSYCAKAGKTCVFPEKQSRTPLTRKNLDAAEDRLRQLEAALQEARSSEPASEIAHQDNAREGVRRITEPSCGTATGTHRARPVEESETPYEWNETPGGNDLGRASHGRKAPDGMASLDDGGEADGYLGEIDVDL